MDINMDYWQMMGRLNRNSERIPRSLPACALHADRLRGLASESKTGRHEVTRSDTKWSVALTVALTEALFLNGGREALPLGRTFPVAWCGELQTKSEK